MNTRKLKLFGAAVIAIVCAVLILITGTYAFQIMTQQGWGRAVSRDQLPAGRLHVDQEVIGDNFGEMNWYPGQSANNEVYVENFGDSTPIFTRVRLFEYMESGIGAQLHPKDGDFAGRDVQPLIEGADRLDPRTWEVILPYSEEDSEPSAFRAYWALTQDGGSKHFMPTFNQDPVSREPDVKGDAWGLVPMSPEQPNSTRRGLPHAVEDERDYLTDQAYAYPPEAGLSDYFEQNPTYEATVKTYDWDLDIHIMDTAPVPHTARETLDAKIMTMEQWHDAGKPVGEIWVLDTDGWAYWAEALEPGEATGLLLNEMTYISPAIGTVYYAIYADAQMATLSSWELAFDDLTDDAEDLMKTIANPAHEIILSESGTVSLPDRLALTTDSADNIITVTNVGNAPTGELSIELSGTNPESFVLSTTSLPNLEVGETVEFTVNSKEGIAIGTHTAIVTVSGNENIAAQSFNVKIAIKDGISLMREGLVNGTAGTSPFLTFPQLQRQQVAQVKVIDLYIPDLNAFAKGTYNDKNIVAAVDVTHKDSDYPVVAFYIASDTAGRSDVFIAGHRGVVATGSLNSFFRALINATNIGVKLLDTSRVTSMNHMFFGASSLKSLDLSGWETSRVTGMSHMFYGTSSLKPLDVSNFDTSSVTIMASMFQGAGSLSTLDLSGFDTSNVTNLSAMFQGTSSLTSLNLSGFDTSRVTNMYAMFQDAVSLTGLNLSGWDTSSVTDMRDMFWNTGSLTDLDFRKATFGKVTNNTGMFTNSGIKTIIVGSTTAQTYIQSVPSWAGAGRTITVVQ